MTANQSVEQPAKPSAHSVIILAAGLSRRLGEPKQLLTRQGQTLLSKTIDMAYQCMPVTMVVVLPQRLNQVVQVVKSAQQRYADLYSVDNPTPETGLASSLKLGINTISTLNAGATLHQTDGDTVRPNKVLILGVDQILLEVSHLQKLLASAQPVVASQYVVQYSPYSAKVTASTASKHSDTAEAKLITGLPLVIDFELLQTWQTKLTGDTGLRHLIRAMPSADICRIRNDTLSFDIDTPAQLAYARMQGWLDG